MNSCAGANVTHEHHLPVLAAPPAPVAMPAATARRPLLLQLSNALPELPEQKISGADEKPRSSFSSPDHARTKSSTSGEDMNSAKHGALNAG